MLFWLQLLALALLTLALTAPELHQTQVQFHNPTILILRDQSASFRNGQVLGLGKKYDRFERTLLETYRNRKFDVRVVDFHEWAWPVATSTTGTSDSGIIPESSLTGVLTSLSAAAEFVDSSAIPNLQGVFLFSDGRYNFNSEKVSQPWAAPLFPVVFDVDSIEEVQVEKMSITLHPNGKSADGVLQYRSVGSRSDAPTLDLVQFGKPLFHMKLPSAAGLQVYRFNMPFDNTITSATAGMQAVVQPGNTRANFDLYNDTMAFSVSNSQNQSRLYIYKPIRSLDEKGMLDILSNSDSLPIGFFGSDEWASLKVNGRDQVWVESEALVQGSGLIKLLESSPAKVVLYARPGTDVRRSSPWPVGTWQNFSPAAEIQVSQQVAEDFPDAIVHLKDLTGRSLVAPIASGQLQAVVGLREAGKQGVLIGRTSLSNGKRALVFPLPKIWEEIFNPQVDFAIRANISAYIHAVRALANLDEGIIRAVCPSRAFHMVPFDLEFQMPESWPSVSISVEDAIRTLKLNVVTTTSRRALPLTTTGNSRNLNWRGLSLPEGQYSLELTNGETVLWKDSIDVASRIALELAHIGFDESALAEAAAQSGGRILLPESSKAPSSNSAKVTSLLPDLPSAQTRMEKTKTVRLYNTVPLFIAVFLLLSIAWLLRKKWDLD